MANPEKSTIDLWLALNLAQQSVSGKAEAALKSADLPPLAWFEVLFELEFAPKGLRPFELQNVLLFKQSNMSRLLKKMVTAGVIAESKVASDGRGKTMISTASGRKLSRKMWRAYSPVLHAAHDEIANNLDPALLTSALQGLVDRKILEHFKVE